MNNIEKLLEGLNPQQRIAVTQTDGKFLVLAGAGSGKTTVLAKRIAFLVSIGVRPWEIVAVSFTKKASNEIKERVTKQIGEDALDVHWALFTVCACVFCFRTRKRWV